MKRTAVAVATTTLLGIVASIGPVERAGPVGARSGWSRESGDEKGSVYSAKRRQFMGRNRYCEIKWDSGCTKLATEIHHRRRHTLPFDEQKLDESLWQATCRHCLQQKQRYLEQAHPSEVDPHHWEL